MAFTAVLRFDISPALLATGAKMPPASPWRDYKRRNVRGEYRDKGVHVGGPGGHEKTRPRKAQGGKLSRFFRRLPDDHHGEKQDKQDNQALHLLSSSARRSRSALHSAAYAEPSRIPQARRYRWRSTIHWSRSRIASVVMACAFMAHFLHSPIVRANLRKSSASSPLTHNRPVRAYSASRSTALFISSFVMVCFLHPPGGRVKPAPR